MTRPFSRRDLLRKHGPAAFLAWPVLSSLRPRSAHADVKKRLITFFSSSGVRQDIFWPKGSPGKFAEGKYSVDGTSLEPLKPYLADVIIPYGITIDRGSGDSHEAGTVACMTGQHLLTQTIKERPVANGESIDHFLAKSLSRDTPEKQLTLGVRLRVNRISKYTTYDENGYNQEPIQNPYILYTKLFKNLIGTCGTGPSQEELEAVARTRFFKKSVLDTVVQETASFKQRHGLNSVEKLKLDKMTEGIRDIERRLDNQMLSTMPSSDNCKTVQQTMEAASKVADTDVNFPKLLTLHMDLMALAAEIDLTRVMTISLSLGGSGGAPMNWLKWKTSDGKLETIDASHHNVTHGAQRNVSNDREKLVAIDYWNFQQFAYLLGKLKAIDDGGATALDNSILWYGTDVGDGKPHSSTNMPYIVAGKAGGTIETGRYERYSGVAHQRLLTDICQRLGQSIGAFGRASSVKGPSIL